MTRRINRTVKRLLDFPVEIYEQEFDIMTDVIVELADLKAALLQEAHRDVQ